MITRKQVKLFEEIYKSAPVKEWAKQGSNDEPQPEEGCSPEELYSGFNTLNNSPEVEPEVQPGIKPLSTNKDKFTYQCPNCGYKMFGKLYSLNFCIPCFELMIPQEWKAGEQASDKYYKIEQEATIMVLEMGREELKERYFKELEKSKNRIKQRIKSKFKQRQKQ